MSTKFNKTLKYNHVEKSLRTPFVVYADLECLLLKQQSSQIIVMDLILKKKLYMNHVVTH